MSIQDLMTKDVVYVNAFDQIRKALSLMKKNSIHQVVVKNDKIRLLPLHIIVTRQIPLRTKVKRLACSVPYIDENEEPEKVARKLLNTGVKALPVVKNDNLVGIISEIDLMGMIDFEKLDSIQLASKCVTIGKSDNIGTALSLMENKHISRLPVVDKDKVVGIIRDLDLIKVLTAEEKFTGMKTSKGSAPGGTKEKMRMEETNVQAIMNNVRMASIEDINEVIMENEEALIRQENDLYVITPKDLLETLVPGPSRQVYVQITNLKGEDDLTQESVSDKVTLFVQKIGKMLDLESFFVHVKRYQKKGNKQKYSIRTRLQTPIGFFVSKAWDWNIITAVQEALSKLEREIINEQKKREDYSKSSKSLP